jgi:hypothetical protein
MRTFLTKKTLLSVFLEKNNFFEPTLEPNSFSEYFFLALDRFLDGFFEHFLEYVCALENHFFGKCFFEYKHYFEHFIEQYNFSECFFEYFSACFFR